MTDTPAPEPRRKGVSWKVLLVVALVTALGGTAGGVVLVKKLGDDNKKNDSASTAQQSPGNQPQPLPSQTADAGAAGSHSPSPTPSSAGKVTAAPSATTSNGVTAPARPVGYTPLLDKKPLAIPGTEAYYDSYRIDLDGGTVVPRGNDLKWGLGLNATGSSSKANSFTTAGDDKSDFAVITEASVTPEQCAIAIDSRPDTDLSFNRVSPGRLLCVRDRLTRNIAIAVVEIADGTTGAVKLTVSTWRAS